MSESYIYTFIREDISPEQKIVQLGHACHEAGKKLGFESHGNVSSLILLSARDEDHLLRIADEIDQHGIDHYVFFEPDNGMGHSALCTRPVRTHRERSLFKQWRLYKS